MSTVSTGNPVNGACGSSLEQSRWHGVAGELRFVSPRKCRMWTMHDRVEDDGEGEACRDLVESVKAHGQRQLALGRPVRDGSDFEIEPIYGAKRLAAARDLGIDQTEG